MIKELGRDTSKQDTPPEIAYTYRAHAEMVLNHPGARATREKIADGLRSLIDRILAGDVIAFAGVFAYQDGSVSTCDYLSGISMLDEWARTGMAYHLLEKMGRWAIDSRNTETSLAAKWCEKLNPPPAPKKPNRKPKAKRRKK